VLLIGLQVGGVLGAFLAVPIAGTIKDTVEAIARSRQSPIEPEPIAQNPTEMASS
jgi:predicted PurR-regulated permease PerM